VSTLAFVLFIGASMSVTAFPVLARILFDRDMFGTHIGRMAIACAAFGDVVGWMILAAVVTLVHADTGAAIATRVLFLSAYLAVMMGVVRPALRWHAARQASGFGAGVNDLSTVLLVLLLSAVATDALGVHALFGAFFAGVMMPASKTLDEAWIDRVQPITVSLLLPLFFAFTGLRTAVNVLDSATLLRDTVLLLGVAIVGKGVFSAVAARATGMAWRESAMLGALLNTRGLMELVILGIGFDLGILTPVVFSMMVVMTLVTTFMTAPLIDLLRPARRPAAAQEVA
jgi:Kef-type K+ transport system membrane component KefB